MAEKIEIEVTQKIETELTEEEKKTLSENAAVSEEIPEKEEKPKIFGVSTFTLALRLTLIVTIVVLALSVVNFFTAPVIEKQEAEKGDIARKELVSDATEFELFTGENPDTTGSVSDIYLAKKDGEVIAYCLNTKASGFGGDVNLVVGILADNTLCGVKVISHAETAGIGEKALLHNGELLPQFQGISSSSVENVVAVSGATVTSKAVKKAVFEACEVVNLLEKGGISE